MRQMASRIAFPDPAGLRSSGRPTSAVAELNVGCHHLLADDKVGRTAVVALTWDARSRIRR